VADAAQNGPQRNGVLGGPLGGRIAELTLTPVVNRRRPKHPGHPEHRDQLLVAASAGGMGEGMDGMGGYTMGRSLELHGGLGAGQGSGSVLELVSGMGQDWGLSSNPSNPSNPSHPSSAVGRRSLNPSHGEQSSVQSDCDLSDLWVASPQPSPQPSATGRVAGLGAQSQPQSLPSSSPLLMPRSNGE
jgi:hypothetical protein